MATAAEPVREMTVPLLSTPAAPRNTLLTSCAAADVQGYF
jgi:hypothetical protein